MKSIVETKLLSKRYPTVTALESCSLDVREGEVFGLLGPNGAGKTTLLRLILGFLCPSSGTATVDSLDCYRRRVQVHQRLSYLPGDARLFRTMRGKDVLRFFGDLRKEADFERSRELAERLELDLSRWVGFMSTGMRQKLALAVSLSIDVPLIILDEPTSNLDPNVRQEISELVLEAKAAGRTVILSSHVLSEVEEVCDRVAILRAGRLVHLQSMHELNRQHRIRAKSISSLPSVPEHLRAHLTIKRKDDHHIEIETPGELSGILHWLANANLQDVYVEPIGLRAIYDRYHSDDGESREGISSDDESMTGTEGQNSPSIQPSSALAGAASNSHQQ